MSLERSLAPGEMASAKWALLAGNFVIGCGVMVVGGTLNDLTADLGVSVAEAGVLIAVAAVTMGVGAPLLAGLLSGVDRRRLLAFTMLWYAVGNLACALAPDIHWLTPLRALTVLSAAVFTPQAAATIGALAIPAKRGQAITFVFTGWAAASVAGMPLAAWVGERMGWRIAVAAVALGALLAALWLARSLPRGIRLPALSWRSWRKVLKSPLLMALVLVTAFQSAGQFTVLAYAAPLFRHEFDASPEAIGLMFAWFGALAFTGNLVLNRVIDRVGAAGAVSTTLALVALSLLLWPLAPTLPWLAVVFVPWALSGFATNSGQQARLGGLSPRLAPALMALNTSAIYLGHALGASGGAQVLSGGGYGQLHWLGLVWVSLALGISVWAHRQQKREAQRGFSKNT